MDETLLACNKIVKPHINRDEGYRGEVIGRMLLVASAALHCSPMRFGAIDSRGGRGAPLSAARKSLRQRTRDSFLLAIPGERIQGLQGFRNIQI